MVSLLAQAKVGGRSINYFTHIKTGRLPYTGFSQCTKTSVIVFGFVLYTVKSTEHCDVIFPHYLT